MTTKTPTIQGVRAKLKREAAAAGLHLELSHSLKGYRPGVQVDTGYTSARFRTQRSSRKQKADFAREEPLTLYASE